MFKKQQRWIAPFVALTFIWLMQVSTMPVAASGASASASLASAEQGPDYVEAVAQKAAPAKKKSMLPWILIGVGVLAVTAAVLILVVMKSYDITGSWSVTWAFSGGGSGTLSCVFTGTKKSGTVSGFYGDSGPYTVDGKNVTWTLTSVDPGFVWTGKFDSKDAMSGTMVYPSEGASGTWTATRVGAVAGHCEPSFARKVAGSWSKTD